MGLRLLHHLFKTSPSPTFTTFSLTTMSVKQQPAKTAFLFTSCLEQMLFSTISVYKIFGCISNCYSLVTSDYLPLLARFLYLATCCLQLAYFHREIDISPEGNVLFFLFVIMIFIFLKVSLQPLTLISNIIHDRGELSCKQLTVRQSDIITNIMLSIAFINSSFNITIRTNHLIW